MHFSLWALAAVHKVLSVLKLTRCQVPLISWRELGQPLRVHFTAEHIVSCTVFKTLLGLMIVSWWLLSHKLQAEGWYVADPVASPCRGGSSISQLGGGAWNCFDTCAPMVHTYPGGAPPWLGGEFGGMLFQKVIGFIHVGGIKKPF